MAVARGRSAIRGSFNRFARLREGRVLPPPSLHERCAVIAEHYRLSEEVYGPNRCCRVMRKFGIKYARLHPQFQAVRDAFVAVTEPAGYREVLDRWYAEDLPGVAPTRLDEGYYGGFSDDQPRTDSPQPQSRFAACRRAALSTATCGGTGGETRPRPSPTDRPTPADSCPPWVEMPLRRLAVCGDSRGKPPDRRRSRKRDHRTRRDAPPGFRHAIRSSSS